MVRKIRAHYDGRFIIPEEPLEWPTNQPMTIQLGPIEQRTAATPPATTIDKIADRILSRCVHGARISDAVLHRQRMYAKEE